MTHSFHPESGVETFSWRQIAAATDVAAGCRRYGCGGRLPPLRMWWQIVDATDVAAGCRRYGCGGRLSTLRMWRQVAAATDVVADCRRYGCGGMLPPLRMWWQIVDATDVVADCRRCGCGGRLPPLQHYRRLPISAISRSAKPWAVSPSWGTASSAASRTAALFPRAMCRSSMEAARSREDGFA